MEAVAILHNTPLPETAALAASSRDVLDQVAAVQAALEAAGYRPFPLAFDRGLTPVLAALAQNDPTVVFNLCETVDEDPSLAGHPAAVLELLQRAFTGSPAQALTVTTDKYLTQRALRSAGIGTPAFALYNPIQALDLRGLRFPVIVKPVLEDASIGIEQESVFADEQLLRDQLPLFFERYGNLLIEEFIPGREFNLAVFGYPQPRLLPPAEIDFSAFPKKLYPIVGYRAKWDPAAMEYQRTPRVFPVDLPPVLAKKLEVTALACFRLFALRDYARIDVRVDGQGNIFVIDVNANPCLSPDAGFAAAAAKAGIGYAALVEQLVAFARLRRARGRQRSLPLQKPMGQDLPDELNWCDGLRPGNADQIGRLAAATGFFSQAETAIAAELATEALTKGEASGYCFFTVRAGDTIIGFSCYGPIPGTCESHDLYWIVVDPAYQARGLGRQLLDRTEARIFQKGGRRVFVDTSQRPQYAPTRHFYETCGYRQEAVLADFYAPGEAKVVYGKRLG